MQIWTDGSGNGRCAFVTSDDYALVTECPGASAPEAEYHAIISALMFLGSQNGVSSSEEDNGGSKNGAGNSKAIREIVIHSDSQVIVRQLNFEYNIKETRLRNLAQQVWDATKTLRDDSKIIVKFKWIPRKENKAGKVLG
jgi:ribonuclease HI